MTKSPKLYRLAAQRQYQDIPSHISRHPADLFWTDHYGSTALHILCQAREVDAHLTRAVDAVLERAPELVSWGNAATWTPLHFAVERWSDEDGDNVTALILKLIAACPQAVSVATRNGYKTRTPFHLSCEADADYRVLYAMLKINPGLATLPLNATPDPYTIPENPLQLIWQHYNSHNALRTEQKMALLLYAAVTRSVEGVSETPTVQVITSPSLLLHSAAMIRCPRNYWDWIVRQYAEHVAQPDEEGYYVLHRALQTELFTTSSTSVIYPQISSRYDQPTSYCHVYNSAAKLLYRPKPAQLSTNTAYSQYVLQTLLKIAPQVAAIPCPRTKRLPLHTALSADECALTWHKGGVEELVHAYPEALYCIDPITQLPPFAMSAEHAVCSRLLLSTTYELLRAAPSMVLVLRNKMDRSIVIDVGSSGRTSISGSIVGDDDKQECCECEGDRMLLMGQLYVI